MRQKLAISLLISSNSPSLILPSQDRDTWCCPGHGELVGLAPGGLRCFRIAWHHGPHRPGAALGDSVKQAALFRGKNGASLLSHCAHEALSIPTLENHIWFLHMFHKAIPKWSQSRQNCWYFNRIPIYSLSSFRMRLPGFGQSALILLTAIIQYVLEWPSNQLFCYNLKFLKSWQRK